MPLCEKIVEMKEEMQQWRQHFHMFPEVAYEETRTAEYISEKLSSFGLDVHQGLGKTGVVGSLIAGTGEKKIALRADIDALYIQELNDIPYKSQNDGIMHACGHDGHISMLLGAAKYLSESKNFDGTVYFIFQPAEEARAGSKKMIDDGLFNIFPAQCVYGMHNFPHIPAGRFAVKPGPIMASLDTFEIQITGKGSHAAMPHQGKDPIVAAAHVINALQTIVSRTIDPMDSAVVSLTQIHGGDTVNSIPDCVSLKGTIRCFNADVQEEIKQQISHITHSICDGLGTSSDIRFNPENPGYPVTWNSENEYDIAARVAADVVGPKNVDLNPVPSMGSEDFAFMLKEIPGCFIWIGNGTPTGGSMLHNPKYDFNDDILTTGASYWVKLVETVLSL
jgi:amidohydrolase